MRMVKAEYEIWYRSRLLSRKDIWVGVINLSWEEESWEQYWEKKGGGEVSRRETRHKTGGIEEYCTCQGGKWRLHLISSHAPVQVMMCNIKQGKKIQTTNTELQAKKQSDNNCDKANVVVMNGCDWESDRDDGGDDDKQWEMMNNGWWWEHDGCDDGGSENYSDDRDEDANVDEDVDEEKSDKATNCWRNIVREIGRQVEYRKPLLWQKIRE